MEIQVGEYVKSTDGFIAKVEEIDEDFIDFDSPIIIGYDGSCSYFGRDQLHFIAKHSFNIIDLLEEGDYVNGKEIEAIDYDEDEQGNLFDILGIIETDDDYAYPVELRKINIRTIVTKEQFEKMEYEVK